MAKNMAKSAAIAATAENLYMQLNASELTAIIMKGSPNSNDRDAGFCSGSSEGGDDLSMDHTRLAPNSPTDAASEDSVEVKVSPIALIRNKRKSSEPSKVVCEREESTTFSNAPLKKRIRYTSTTDSAVVLTPPATYTTPPPHQQQNHHHQHHWDASQVLPHELMPNPAQVFVRHPGVTTLHRVPMLDVAEQQEPLALVLRKPVDREATVTVKQEEVCSSTPSKSSTAAAAAKAYTPPSKKLQVEAEKFSHHASLSPHPQAAQLTSADDSQCGDSSGASTSHAHSSAASASGRPQQRNYKNMTRERRIEANARERTRVHTISAAYETLRHAVPSYSHAQKLSKLSVLRVACSYILTLSRMAGHDYSADQSEPSIASCFESVTETIQTEGKIRKKKDE